MSGKRYNVMRAELDQAEMHGRAEEFILEGLTIQEIAQKLGSADKVVMYYVVTYGLVGSGAGTVEEMRRTERARLEEAIQAIWLRVTRGDLDGARALLQAEHIMMGLCGPDVGRDQAEPAEAEGTVVRPGAEDAERLDSSTEEFPSEGLNIPGLLEESGHTDKIVAYDVVQYTLVEAKAGGAEKMQRAEGARLERVIQAAWPRVLRRDLEAMKIFLEALRLKVRLYGLDVGRDQATAAQAEDLFIQVGTKDPKHLRDLTDEELSICIASLEKAQDNDDVSRPPLGTNTAENPVTPSAEDGAGQSRKQGA